MAQLWMATVQDFVQCLPIQSSWYHSVVKHGQVQYLFSSTMFLHASQIQDLPRLVRTERGEEDKLHGCQANIKERNRFTW